MRIPQNQSNQNNLDVQKAAVIERLASCDQDERRAVVRHIDGLLAATRSPTENEFWQSVSNEILESDTKDVSMKNRRAESRRDFLKRGLAVAASLPLLSEAAKAERRRIKEEEVRQGILTICREYRTASPKNRAAAVRDLREQAQRRGGKLGKWYDNFADALVESYGV